MLQNVRNEVEEMDENQKNLWFVETKNFLHIEIFETPILLNIVNFKKLQLHGRPIAPQVGGE